MMDHVLWDQGNFETNIIIFLGQKGRIFHLDFIIII